jgi:hypothetical protein
MTDYKINIQTIFTHQNFSSLDSDANILLKIIKGNETRTTRTNLKNSTHASADYKNIFEIDEKNLDDIISRLKEFHSKIKN